MTQTAILAARKTAIAEDRVSLSATEQLAQGELEIVGQIMQASNVTLLAKLVPADILCIYKPQTGERPLWDFPAGTLCFREVAAYVVSDALGFDLVPPTIMRSGPYGVGSVQLFVDSDPDVDLDEYASKNLPLLEKLFAFDILINNADRKGSHCLVDKSGQLRAVDHGVAFHTEPKLRSVVWAFAGERVSVEIRKSIDDWLTKDVRGLLGDLLAEDEIEALGVRAGKLATRTHYPFMTDRNIPWPPW